MIDAQYLINRLSGLTLPPALLRLCVAAPARVLFSASSALDSCIGAPALERPPPSCRGSWCIERYDAKMLRQGSWHAAAVHTSPRNSSCACDPAAAVGKGPCAHPMADRYARRVWQAKTLSTVAPILLRGHAGHSEPQSSTPRPWSSLPSSPLAVSTPSPCDFSEKCTSGVLWQLTFLFFRVAMSQQIFDLQQVARSHGLTLLAPEQEPGLRKGVRLACTASWWAVGACTKPADICFFAFIAQLDKKWHLPEVIHHFMRLWHWFLFVGHDGPTPLRQREDFTPLPRPKPDGAKQTYILLDNSSPTSRSSA